MVTAYDYTMAQLVDAAGVDGILVGDSLGMVVQGHPNTLPVTMKQMLYHAEMVGRGAQRALLVADMPFLSYQLGPRQAIRNAGLFLKRTRCRSSQTGARATADRHYSRPGRVRHPRDGPLRSAASNDPSIGRLSRGARGNEADRGSLIRPGGRCSFAVLLEYVPAELAQQITAQLQIPTIGIGAGPHCDGQILVLPTFWG